MPRDDGGAVPRKELAELDSDVRHIQENLVEQDGDLRKLTDRVGSLEIAVAGLSTTLKVVAAVIVFAFSAGVAVIGLIVRR